MKTKIIAASILSLMAAAPALAQTAQPNAPAQPMERAPAERMETPAAPSATDMTKDLDRKEKVTMSSTKDWRASKLIGASVVNAANEAIGDINDVLIDGSGKVTNVIVGVGGFLGIGEKNVALAFDELTFARNESGNPKVMSKSTKESLESMAEWKPSDNTARTGN